MPVAPSFNDFVAQGLSEAQEKRPDLQFREGDLSLAQIHAGAAMADAVTRFAIQSLAATFIDLAEGDDLAALVSDHLGIEKHPATAAAVTLSFSRTSSGAAGSIPAGVVAATAVAADGSSISFTTQSTIPVGLGANGPFTVAAVATTLGRESNVAAGSVIRITSDLFDATFSVTNPAAAAGGNAAESDAQLKVRARLFWEALRRGTMGALEFGALQVPEVRVVRASEGPTGLVTVSVTDETGASNAEMVSLVEAELEGWRAAGAVVLVVGGELLLVNLALRIFVRSGVSVAALEADGIAAVTARVAKLVMGDVLYQDAIKAAAINLDPDGITHVMIDAPTGDVVPQPHEVIRANVVTWAAG
jgi:Baseplate J-like protein